MISKDTIDRILDAAQIVDVVSDFVALRRRGANYTACCPFHHEKTPSFSVSPAKGIYKCFGCGKAGNSVNFIMEHEHLGYVDALKYLGRKFGIEVQDKEETQAEAENRLRSESILAVTQFASEFYQKSLWETDQGISIGIGYFKERGFTSETIKKFSLGWAPGGRDSMSSAAQKAGYKKEYLVDSGLSVEREAGKDVVDRFYERVMFPIHSISGRVIAFGGRTLRSDKNIAKYINSPETEIYVKSKSLYGIYQAKSSIAKLQKCYLVEGYTDVISFHQAGVENVVASSGTSLTTEQIRLVKRFTPEVAVLYDGDPAGIKASLRGIDMLLEEGLRVKVVLFPDGEDPDSFARKKGPQALRKFLDESEEDFIAFKTRLLSDDTKKDPLKRAQLISEVVASISVIPDAISRAVYIEECSQRLNIAEEILSDEVKKLRKKKQYGAYGQTTESRSEPGMPKYFPPLETGEKIPEFITGTYCEPAEKELLYYLIRHGESNLYGTESQNDPTSPEAKVAISVSQFILNELQNDDLELQNLVYKKIFDEYYKIREKGQEYIQKYFINHPDPQIVQVILDILHQEHSLTVKIFVESVTPEEQMLPVVVPKSILIYKAKITAIAYQEICNKLADAEKSGDAQIQNELMEQVQILMHIRNSFSKELKRLTI
ncbi:MAG: DNA primase [Bacteroidia bacterium]|jgi:DNA primase|nr:DNA primase [Rikenellaceae bacterium]NCB18024.1 DNA primase [Bacteroidia bacterium]